MLFKFTFLLNNRGIGVNLAHVESGFELILIEKIPFVGLGWMIIH